ncbi:MAG: hypothetical protein L0177_03950 [Chloroflexi bacterium]|nr:hypothetical protein [Chloroflexota bacterium]
MPLSHDARRNKSTLTPSKERRSSSPSRGQTEQRESGGFESVIQGDFSLETFEKHAAILGNPRLSHPANALRRAQIARRLQRDYGNAYVQRLVEHIEHARGETPRNGLGVETISPINTGAAPVQRVGERLLQALGYKIGSGKSQEVLEKAFDGKKFDTSNVLVVTESELIKKFEEKYGKDSYKKYGPLEGFTLSDEGKIYINKDAQTVDTVPHEILHKNSKKNVLNNMGFNLNEGITEYLTQKAVSGAGFKPTSSYPKDLAVVKTLVAIVGEAKIESAYFDGDVDALKGELDKKKGAGVFDTLVAAMKKDDYGAAHDALK